MIPGIAPAIVRLTGSADPLAEFYGSGDGDIVIDWDFSDADTVSINGSNEITAVANKGGWGSSYDLEGLPTRLLYDAGGFAIPNSSLGRANIGTNVNLYGLHALVSLAGDYATVLSGSYNNPSWRAGGQFGYNRVAISIIGKSFYIPTALGVSNLIEYEARIDAAAEIVDGRGAGGGYSQSFTGTPSATYTHVGTSQSGQPPPDLLRRIVMVKQDSAYDMSDPEPAVLAARAWLEADADAYNDGL